MGLDIAAIKRTALQRVSFLPGAQEFLLKLKKSGKRRVLVTNAHPLTLAIKNEQVRLTAHFDACYSTHTFDAPKEDAAVLAAAAGQGAISSRSARYSSMTALPVLDAAHRFGIAWLRAVRLPDSRRPAQDTGRYAAVDRVADLM